MNIELALKNCVEFGTFSGCTEERASYKYFLSEGTPVVIGFNSNVCFGRIVYSVNDRDNDIITESLFVKTILGDQKCDMAFSNEISVYSKILPFLAEFDSDRAVSISELVSKFYYGNMTVKSHRTDHAIIVLENLSAKSFELNRHTFFLDFEHLSLAMTALGRLHVRSYLAKRFDAERFEDRMNWLHRLSPIYKNRETIGNHMLYFLEVFQHSNPIYRTKLFRLHSVIENFAEFIDSLYSKSNRTSTSVFSHGDMVRSNLLFKYSDDGRPIDVKMFDFGAARYCSPAFDLCNLLYLSTNQQTRDEHWDELLGLYHRSMLNFSPIAASVVPSLESIVSEFTLYVPHIYSISTFFVPLNIADKYEQLHPSALPKNVDSGEYILELIKSCPESALQELNEILKDMIHRGFV